MARINLLPWRAERQKERKKQFGVMLGVAAVSAVAMWFIINMYYNAQISGQQKRNAFLDQEITAVEAKLEEIKTLEEKKKNLLNRKKAIEDLQANRSQMVHLFDQLVRTIPDGVILTSIKQDGDKLTLEGRSQSNARVSTYMRNFEPSGWMSKPELSIIEAEGDNKGLPYTFTLTVTLTNPNEKKEGETTAPGGGTAATTAATTETLQPLTPVQPAAGGPGAAPATAPAAGTPATGTPAAGTPAATPATAPANSQSAKPEAPAAAPSGGSKS